jgi:cytochrome c peroxidase
MLRLLSLLVCLMFATAVSPRPATPADQLVFRQFVADKNRFHQDLQQLADLVGADAPADSLRAAFRRSRKGYKRVEWLLEYYQPYMATRVNGPPVVEVEEDEPGQHTTSPTGLQVIEPYLFPVADRTQKASLLRELNVLLSYAVRLEQSIPADRLTDGDILDAMRQQLFRIVALGITGYDAPEARSGLAESAVSLSALRDAFIPYSRRLPEATASALEQRWAAAIRLLNEANSFDDFDRVMFIRQQFYPLCRALGEARQSLSIPVSASGRFLSPLIATLSDSGAFRPDYLTTYSEFISSPRKIALGKILFFDPLLSGNNARSCASCHRPERAFTDGLTKSRAFGSRKRVDRNAPTLLNAGLQKAQFYDSRALYLEDQVHDVLKNTHEMRTSPEEVIQKLSASKQYRTWFNDAFGDGLTAPNVRNSLACYVRSLTSLNARPDRYLKGENVLLSADEQLGFNLFLGKARCATCHFFPIYNGFVPPHYEKVESELIGVPRRRKIRKAKLDRDPGKFNAYHKDLQRFAFKTPTVRNVALTAPYMHNGSYRTLAQVVDFYNRGGGRGIGIQLDGQTLPSTPLNLNLQEQNALVTFLNALTDTTGYTHRPRQLPIVEGHQTWNRRKPGGRY